MNEILERMYKHPFVTILLIGTTLGGVADIVRGFKGVPVPDRMRIVLENAPKE